MNRKTKIDAELVVAPREVLEARPRSSPPPSDANDKSERPAQEDDVDNAPCTD